MINKKTFLIILAVMLSYSAQAKNNNETPEFWKNATVYFMLTDRFNNADKSNDVSYGRTTKAAPLRGFEGGDIKGITNKINDGYFSKLGVDAIWMTPLIEQVHGYDTSAGLTYSYHGYWPKDWTAVDANYGNEADLKAMIEAAHSNNIKVLMDVIINHTGPKTKADWAWPTEWIRTQPICNWSSYEQNTKCALASSLTDIKTEIEHDVKLPSALLNKWQAEGRLEQELDELGAFFKRTGYPRAPKYYIVKWLTDWVKEYGIDGFRVDTAKHVEPEIWQALKHESELSYQHWKTNNPLQVKDDLPFYMVGEVFNWGVDGFKNTVKNSRAYNYGDKQVDFFNYGFDALINMGFVSHVSGSAEQLFSTYSTKLHSQELQGVGILNYISSHDDESSYDRQRNETYEAAFKLMLAPGGVQIYYGDELARPLYADKNVFGDAHLRTVMNWQDLNNKETQDLLAHWQKLGRFRQGNTVVGAGIHTKLQDAPYIFKRSLAGQNNVLVANGLEAGKKSIHVYNTFEDGTVLKDHYSNQIVEVINGHVTITSKFTYLLLAINN